MSILKAAPVDEIYHLAAQSHVETSFNLQLYSCDVDALGTLRILQAIRSLDLHSKVKFFNVSRSPELSVMTLIDKFHSFRLALRRSTVRYRAVNSANPPHSALSHRMPHPKHSRSGSPLVLGSLMAFLRSMGSCSTMNLRVEVSSKKFLSL